MTNYCHLSYEERKNIEDGLNSIIQKWLSNNCQETPEEIEKIIINEYKKT